MENLSVQVWTPTFQQFLFSTLQETTALSGVVNRVLQRSLAHIRKLTDLPRFFDAKAQVFHVKGQNSNESGKARPVFCHFFSGFAWIQNVGFRWLKGRVTLPTCQPVSWIVTVALNQRLKRGDFSTLWICLGNSFGQMAEACFNLQTLYVVFLISLPLNSKRKLSRSPNTKPLLPTGLAVPKSCCEKLQEGRFLLKTLVVRWPSGQYYRPWKGQVSWSLGLERWRSIRWQSWSKIRW